MVVVKMEHNTDSRHRIKLESLKVGYRKSLHREITIFGPVTTEITQAEMVGIIGRNGIGKSTLLRTIAGLQSQLHGKVLVDGIDNSRIPAKERARLISFVSTEPVAAQHIRVGEMVSMGRFPHTGWLGLLQPMDLELIHQAAEMTSIQHLMSKFMQELSDGERQKVMIARALAQDTPIIILDEPTAYLDLPARYDILRILNDLTLIHHKTILFTTHDLAIALEVADKLWLMAEGELFEGAPEDLLIDKVFRKLFLNSPAEFDVKTSSFRLRRNLEKDVTILGDKKYRLLTRKAMERIGFRTNDEVGSVYEVIVGKHQNGLSWQFHCNETSMNFNSIYALASYMKNLL
jgi:iron complex transport system ATP-binding protein